MRELQSLESDEYASLASTHTHTNSRSHTRTGVNTKYSYYLSDRKKTWRKAKQNVTHSLSHTPTHTYIAMRV